MVNKDFHNAINNSQPSIREKERDREREHKILLFSSTTVLIKFPQY